MQTNLRCRTDDVEREASEHGVDVHLLLGVAGLLQLGHEHLDFLVHGRQHVLQVHHVEGGRDRATKAFPDVVTQNQRRHERPLLSFHDRQRLHSDVYQ